MEANSEYLEVQGSLAAQFNGIRGTAADLCEKSGKGCARTKANKSAYCKKHTCGEKKCYRLKLIKADYCKQHQSETGL